MITALAFCWAVLGADGQAAGTDPGRADAPAATLAELSIARRDGALLVGVSPATVDWRLAPDRAKPQLSGRPSTKSGSLLKSRNLTCAQCDDAMPGFVEIDMVWHEDSNAIGDHAYTRTRSVKNNARRWEVAALEQITAIMPFLIIGVDSDNGSEVHQPSCDSTADQTSVPRRA